MNFHIIWLCVLMRSCFTAADATDFAESSNQVLTCMTLRYTTAKYRKYCVSDHRHADVEYPDLQLSIPQSEDCQNRVFHLRTILGNQYYISWLAGVPEKSWIDARNFCREMCMELIALESVAENAWLKRLMSEMQIKEVWTAGRFCDFKGCEFTKTPQVWPRQVRGWFWAGTHTRLGPFVDTITTDWAHEPGKFRQPDGKSYNASGKDESCLAMINKPHVKGTHWHDEECSLRKPFICEESDILLRHVEDGYFDYEENS
ncbi:uncharacterized protein LOC109537179 isoform X1 [Dendroctonus ponderosae]|uniref:uncharacterized protein LOC109537179 isoform X1 n=1 Tax=Dendroctonus ponderosae TaxID=77166 RepID=UPI0020365E94|nr:uncharacterized protein LOC109537179 isoform X1 [Dendroctonus ponderosae]